MTVDLEQYKVEPDFEKRCECVCEQKRLLYVFTHLHIHIQRRAGSLLQREIVCLGR